jgi:hypothetical protein
MLAAQSSRDTTMKNFILGSNFPGTRIKRRGLARAKALPTFGHTVLTRHSYIQRLLRLFTGR